MAFREGSFDPDDSTIPGRDSFLRALQFRKMRHDHEKREKKVPTRAAKNPELPIDEQLEMVRMSAKDWERMVQANDETRQLPLKRPHKLIPVGKRAADFLVELTLADRLWLEEIGIPFIGLDEDGLEPMSEL